MNGHRALDLATLPAPVTHRGCAVVLEAIAARFWAKVVKSPSHWVWTGARRQRGFGNFAIDATRRELAHRVSWAILRGAIPAAMVLKNKCGRRDCVRASHWRLVPRSRTREAWITPTRVREIQAQIGVPARVLAQVYGISERTVHRARCADVTRAPQQGTEEEAQ